MSNPINTPPATATYATTETPSPTSSNTGNRNSRRPNRRNDSSIGENRDFAGETLELDAVLGLTSERLNKGTSFEIFQEKLGNYVLKNLPKAEDVIILVSALQDPLSPTADPSDSFEIKYCPAEPDETKQKIPIKMKVWEMKIKRYLDREDRLNENINKMYGLVIGKFTIASLSTLRSDKYYEKKSKLFDVLWLLKKIKTITAGVDLKEKPVLSIHEQIFLSYNASRNNGK